MYPSLDDGGSFVEQYVLEIDQGLEDTEFKEVSSYDKQSFLMQHTLTFASDNIITGKIYTFRFKSVNSKGSSEYSEYLSIAANIPPLKANDPYVVYSMSSRTSIFVKWDRNQDGVGVGGLITGYKLYMDDGYGGELVEVLDTVGFSSQINEFLAVNLTASL
jgi:hypothetical protein